MSRELKFGVELEVATSKSDSYVVDALKSSGINAHESWYGSSVDLDAWKVHYDGSLNLGWEIVSPPSYDLGELETVANVLRKDIKAKATKRCGFHVHHDISDFGLQQFKNLYRLYDKYTDAINSILNPSRRYNSYCQPIHHDLIYIEAAQTFDKLKYEISYHSRYKALNAKSYLKYGTIEFRQHQATTSAEDAITWVILTHKFVETASEVKEIKKTTLCTSLESQLMEMFNEIGLADNDFVIKHYMRMQKKFGRMAS
jgi:glycyl-tRNA synthetase beta subunit